MMTIDEGVRFCNEKSKNIKLKADPEVFTQLAEWMEELKAYKEQHQALCNSYNVHTVEDIYGKAIDDIMNMLDDIEFCGGTKETLACANATLNYIKKEVEQLRSGGEQE